MVFLRASVANRHINVTGRLADAITAALCTGREPLQRGALFDVDGLHLQFVDVSRVVVLGVGDGAVQRFEDNAGGLLRGEAQDVSSLLDIFAADHVGHQTTLVD
jgi:hypothetical protein